MIETTGANNFSWKVQRDLNGDGIIDRAQTRTTTVGNDGARTVAFTDNAYSGANGTTITLKSSVTTATSDDGFSVSYSYSGIALAWSVNLFTRGATEVTVLNADGSRTKTTSTLNASSALLDRQITTVSGTGLSTTSTLDIDGNGTIEISKSSVTAVDGARTLTVELKNQSGTLLQKYLETQSADNLTTQSERDTNGDGIYDRLHRTVQNGDKSKTETWQNSSATGVLKDRVVTTTSADNLTQAVQVDSNGDGVIDIGRSVVISFNADGSSNTIVSETNGSGALLSKTTSVTSDDGLVINATIDSNGDGVTDATSTATTVMNADGTTTTTEQYRTADNVLQRQTVTTTSANGRSTVIALDSDGNGVNDKVTTRTTNADDTKTELIQYYSSTGTLTSSVTKTTSADGLTVTRQWSNGASETMETLAEA